MNAFHAFALRATRALSVVFENFFQPSRVLFGFFEMFFETSREFRTRGGLCHLWKRFDDLIFRAVKVFQFVNVQVF